MARINSAARSQQVVLDDSDSAEGLAIFFSQDGSAEARYRFLVKAVIDQGVYDIGEFYTSPPGATDIPGRLSRMVAGAICPGATGWRVEVSCVASPEIPSDETADVILASSRCCAEPGVKRVGERYNYETGTGTSNFTVRAGMTVTGIAALGLVGDGSVTIAGGSTIVVPAGISVNLAPEAPIPPNSVIAFGNCDWTVEYLESA